MSSFLLALGEAAARAFIADLATIEPKGGHHVVEMNRLLKSNKDSATKSRTRAINQIKAILITAPAFLTLQHSLLLWSIALLQQQALRYLARRVLQLEKEIAELLEDLDQLTQQACPGLRKTYAVSARKDVTLRSVLHIPCKEHLEACS